MPQFCLISIVYEQYNNSKVYPVFKVIPLFFFLNIVFLLTYFIYWGSQVNMPIVVGRSQRVNWGSQFSPATMWVLGTQLSLPIWEKAPLPESHLTRPFLHFQTVTRLKPSCTPLSSLALCPSPQPPGPAGHNCSPMAAFTSSRWCTANQAFYELL